MHPYTIYDSEKICNPRDKKNGLMYITTPCVFAIISNKYILKQFCEFILCCRHVCCKFRKCIN